MNERKSPGILINDGQPIPTFSRLVILVPNADLDEIKLARRIRTMMPPDDASILLISIVTQIEEEPLERRRLINLAVIMGDPVYRITCKTISGTHWTSEIRDNLRQGDLLVCLDWQNAPSKNKKIQPIGQELANDVPYPVYLLKNISIREAPIQTLTHRIIGWAAPILTILFFLVFDIRLAQEAGGWTTNLLLFTSLLVEAGLILSWSNLWN